MEYGIILFDSTHSAMKSEAVLLKQLHLPVRIIPTPSSIKATCGFAMRYDLADEATIFETIANNNLTFESVVHALGKGLNITYHNIEM